MTIAAILARYGLIAIFIGAGVEGETVVVTGGVMAHQGLVPLAGAMAVAVLGSFTADQLLFLTGRRFRDHPRVVRWMRKPAFARALTAFERHPAGFILAFRFIYGFRTISPVAIGTTGVSARMFVTLNAVAALVWGTLFTTLGYVFGQGITALLDRYSPSVTTVGIAAATVAALILGVQWWRKRRAA